MNSRKLIILFPICLFAGSAISKDGEEKSWVNDALKVNGDILASLQGESAILEVDYISKGWSCGVVYSIYAKKSDFYIVIVGYGIGEKINPVSLKISKMKEEDHKELLSLNAIIKDGIHLIDLPIGYAVIDGSDAIVSFNNNKYTISAEQISFMRDNPTLKTSKAYINFYDILLRYEKK